MNIPQGDNTEPAGWRMCMHWTIGKANAALQQSFPAVCIVWYHLYVFHRYHRASTFVSGPFVYNSAGLTFGGLRLVFGAVRTQRWGGAEDAFVPNC